MTAAISIASTAPAGLVLAAGFLDQQPGFVKLAAAAAAVVIGIMVLLWFLKQLILSFISDSVARIGSSFFGSLFGLARRELSQGARVELSGPRSRSESAGGRAAEREQAAARRAEGLRARLADLKKNDPAFSEEKFKDQAATSLVKVLEAVEKKDLALARELVTPPLFQRLAITVDELVRQNRVRTIDQFEVKSVELTDARHDGPYFQLSVAVRARAIDFTAESDGRVVAGGREQRDREYGLTFLRPDKVKTPSEKPGPSAANCPNCGAPLKLTALGRCDYCDSQVISGEFSWTLSELGSRD